MRCFKDNGSMKRCCQIYFQINFSHHGLRRLVTEEGSTTVALARVLPSLGKTRADHGDDKSVPGKIIAFWEHNNGHLEGRSIMSTLNKDITQNISSCLVQDITFYLMENIWHVHPGKLS